MRLSRERKPITPTCNACESPALLGGASCFHNDAAGIGRLGTGPPSIAARKWKARQLGRATKRL